MKKLFVIALLALGCTFQGNLFGQTTLTDPTGPGSLSGQEVVKVISETSAQTGISGNDLQDSYDKGEMSIEETNDGFNVYLSAEHGGGLVILSEENF